MALFREISRFLTSMDAKAATSLVVSIVLLAFVFLMFFFGRQWLHLDDENELRRVLFEASQSAWAVPVVVSVFVILALTGFPQILLITATVLTFGAKDGAFFSWLATMISATLTFGLGHWFGGRFPRPLRILHQPGAGRPCADCGGHRPLARLFAAGALVLRADAEREPQRLTGTSTRYFLICRWHSAVNRWK